MTVGTRRRRATRAQAGSEHEARHHEDEEDDDVSLTMRPARKRKKTSNDNDVLISNKDESDDDSSSDSDSSSDGDSSESDSDEDDGMHAVAVRTGATTTATRSHSHHVFRAYRALGFVVGTDHETPCAFQYHGNKTFLCVGVGKTFQLYNCDKLHLSFVGPRLDHRVRDIVMYKNLIVTASAADVTVWHRSRKVAMFLGSKTAIRQMLVLGGHLIALDSSRRLLVWDLESTRAASTHDGASATDALYVETIKTIDLGGDSEVTVMMHPPTYLNKIVVAREDGTMELWNLRSGRLIFTVRHEWNSPILCVESSPAVDVVGVGLADGRVIVHNLKADRTLVEFRQADQGPVTHLSFRTDGQSILAAAGRSGNVVLWDLEEDGGRLLTVMKDAHEGSLTALTFLPRQPVLVSCGVDNSIKMWIFDQAEAGGRVLRSRSGHSEPPTHVRFYGTDDSRHLLSSGPDRSVRVVSTILDRLNRELSQGKKLATKAAHLQTSAQHLKLSPVTAIDSCAVREREWDNVLTGHEGDHRAYTWNFERRSIGKYKLGPRHSAPSPCTSVGMSACGHFGFVGRDSGVVDKYNMQSGKHRGSSAKSNGAGHHTASITSLCTDAVNERVYSASLDGTVKIWKFQDLTLLDTIEVGAPVGRMRLQRDNGLLAVCCDDLVIRLYDSDARPVRLVRRLEGQSSQVTDLDFSADGRWVVSASLDATIYVWDIPSGRAIDSFVVEKPVTSLSLSPTGDYLATTHVGSVGVFLWANEAHFGHVRLGSLSLASPSAAPVSLPAIVGVEEEDEDEDEDEREDNDSDDERSGGEEEESDVERDGGEENGLVEPLAAGLVTLSNGRARATSHTLASIDVIKKRNKPREAPKKPADAPFFLKTLPGLDPKFITSEEEDSDAIVASAHALRMNHTPFMKALVACERKAKYSSALSLLVNMSPSAIDVEIRSLNDVDVDGGEDVACFLNLLLNCVRQNVHFELVQACLNVLLKVHGSSMIASPALVRLLKRVHSAQKESWGRLEGMFQNNVCLMQWFSGIQA